jgi:hypothetical protein
MIPQEVDVDARQSGDSAGGLLDVPLRHPVRIEDQAVTKIMSPEELEQALRAIGAERYHDKHPFHKLLHGGKLNKGQVQAWALNRYCYQSAVPRKDAALISRCHDRQLRRDWDPSHRGPRRSWRGGRRHRALAGVDRRARA